MTQNLFEFAREERPTPAAEAPRSISSTQVTSGTAARLMKVSRGTIESLCEEGKLRAWRVTDRGWWRIDFSSLMEFLAERRDKMLFPENK